MMGGWVGALVGALTALPSLIEAIGMATETTAEKIERLKTNVTNATNESIKDKDELRTLENYKRKYDELSKSQYDSAESK
jgi:cell division ATPase FtsA